MPSNSIPEDALAPFVAELAYSDLPDDVVGFVERRFVDTVGVMIAGTRADPGKIVGDMIQAPEPADETSQRQISEADHGFMFGTMGHALDFDDSTHAAHAHLSVSLVSTIVTLSRNRTIDGPTAITAYVSGFETALYLAEVVMDDHYRQGWHATSTLGTYAATAAASSILDLNAEKVRTALNICSSMPAGLRCNFGTITKPIHAGQAVRSGITAATLARNGCTATDTAISGSYGFIEIYTDSNPSTYPDQPGDVWGIRTEGVNTKKYPCCHASHAGIEAAIQLLEDWSIQPDQIHGVTVTTSELAGENLQYENPQDSFQAKFSMEYPLACAIVHGAVTPEMFKPDSIQNAAVQEMRRKIDHTVDADLPYKYETTVTIETVVGERYSHSVESPPGMSDSLDSEVLREKFMDCTDIMAATATEELYSGLDGLRGESDISYIPETVIDCYQQ